MESRIKDALTLLETSREGALATLEESGPFVSAVGFIYDSPAAGEKWGKVRFLLSELARHTKNIQKIPKVSLLITEAGAAPAYEKKRVTLQGTIRCVKEDASFKQFKTRYLQSFPSSEMLFGMSDFRFFEMEISNIHWIAGFGRIETFQ